MCLWRIGGRRQFSGSSQDHEWAQFFTYALLFICLTLTELAAPFPSRIIPGPCSSCLYCSNFNICAAGASTHFPSWKWQGHGGKRWNSPGPPVMVNVVVSVFLFGELHIAVDGELQTTVENGISTFEGFWHQRKKNWVLTKRISLEDEQILCRPFMLCLHGYYKSLISVVRKCLKGLVFHI